MSVLCRNTSDWSDRSKAGRAFRLSPEPVPEVLDESTPTIPADHLRSYYRTRDHRFSSKLDTKRTRVVPGGGRNLPLLNILYLYYATTYGLAQSSLYHMGESPGAWRGAPG